MTRIKLFPRQCQKSKLVQFSLINLVNIENLLIIKYLIKIFCEEEPKKGRKGKFRDIDNEEDYSDKNNTARPPATATLFDALKTKLNLNGKIRNILNKKL